MKKVLIGDNENAKIGNLQIRNFIPSVVKDKNMIIKKIIKIFSKFRKWTITFVPLIALYFTRFLMNKSESTFTMNFWQFEYSTIVDSW